MEARPRLEEVVFLRGWNYEPLSGENRAGGFAAFGAGKAALGSITASLTSLIESIR